MDFICWGSGRKCHEEMDKKKKEKKRRKRKEEKKKKKTKVNQKRERQEKTQEWIICDLSSWKWFFDCFLWPTCGRRPSETKSGWFFPFPFLPSSSSKRPLIVPFTKVSIRIGSRRCSTAVIWLSSEFWPSECLPTSPASPPPRPAHRHLQRSPQVQSSLRLQSKNNWIPLFNCYLVIFFHGVWSNGVFVNRCGRFSLFPVDQ